MKVEQEPGTPRLYPDLSGFYPSNSVDGKPSPDLAPPPPPHRALPTAPPLEESRHDLHREDGVPEEPEKDYMLDDCSLHPGDLTADYSLDDISLEDLVELEPDYDTDDLHQDTLNDLNNLNLTATEKKILHDKNIEVPPPPRKDQDFRAWVTWRMQANRLLAAVILTRSGQHVRVRVRESEIRRKPLTRQNVENVVQRARGGEQGRRGRSAPGTSLPACPYVMYGIPRVNLTHASQRP